MKKNLTLLLSLVIGQFLMAQAFMDKVTESTCQCIAKIKPELSRNQMELELGLCMLQAAQPYQKEIKKEYDIDMSNYQEDDMEHLGKIVGMKLAVECPSFLKLFVGEEEEEEATIAILEVRGTITRVEINQFIVFHVEDKKGKTTKLIWLEAFEGSDQIQVNYPNLVGKDVEMKYEEKDLFDPRVQEYLNYNIIRELAIK